MTSQKTIERCRLRVKELEEANATLLKNNETLAAANKKLREDEQKERAELIKQSNLIHELEVAKSQCRQKCELIVSEKERLLQQKEQYIANLKSTVWHLQNSFTCKFYGFKETPQGFKFELEFHNKGV